jgi:organic hydroperoxide reductase OsmC/OhrA
VVVLEYRDEASGSMRMHPDGSGEFTEVTLRPQVLVEDTSTAERALALHEDAGKLCQIARSVAFPIRHEPSVSPAPPAR